MSGTSDGERIPVLYSIHHCYYGRYPDDADVLELSDETINVMKGGISANSYSRDICNSRRLDDEWQ